MSNQLQAVAKAPVPIAGEEQQELNQFLTFHVGEELFAIGILDIKEIIEVFDISPVPLTPPFVRGVINLRGRVVPVIDLSVRLDRPATRLTKRSCVVIVAVPGRDGRQCMGMLVDEVKEVLEIADDAMQPAPEFGADIRTDFIDRMGRVDERFIVILSIDHVLSVEELAALSDLQKRARGVAA